jgi:hypothetical protein
VCYFVSFPYLYFPLIFLLLFSDISVLPVVLHAFLLYSDKPEIFVRAATVLTLLADDSDRRELILAVEGTRFH